MHSEDLSLLDRLLGEVRRLLVLTPLTREDLTTALEQIEQLRNAAREGGSVDLAAQLSAVSACIRGPMAQPDLARDPLLEAKMHLTMLRQDYADAA